MLYIHFIVTQISQISQIFCHTEKTAFELRSLANERTQEIAETTKWIALQKVVNQTFINGLECENGK